MGVLEIDTTIAFLAQMQALSVQNAAMQKQLDMLSTPSPAPVLQCDFCHGNHPNRECAVEATSNEQVNYMNT